MTLNKDRELAIRHLKRALLLDPQHGKTLSLLAELGESRDLTFSEVAEEVLETVTAQTNHTPGLRRLSRTQQLVAAGVIVLLVPLIIFALYKVLFPHTGPAYIPAQPPQAEAVRLVNASSLFSQFTASGLPMFAVHQISSASTPGKTSLKFTVPASSGQTASVQIVVYESIAALVRDRSTHREWESHSQIVASGNALLVYANTLRGLLIEDQLIRQFRVITGA